MNLDEYKLVKGQTDWHENINNALDSIGGGLRDLVKIKTFTARNITFGTTPPTTKGVTVDVTNDGYTPIAVVSTSLSNETTNGQESSGCYVYNKLIKNNTCSIDIKHITTTAVNMKCDITILYLKTDIIS